MLSKENTSKKVNGSTEKIATREKVDILSVLQRHLQSSDDWAKLRIKDVPNVSVVRMPGSVKYKPKLGLEIVPVRDDGSPLKKRNLYITNLEYLESLLEIFSNKNKILEVMKMINDINKKEENTDGEILDLEV
jgi:hypothetical protein